jgi:LacI family transcriptional regulator
VTTARGSRSPSDGAARRATIQDVARAAGVSVSAVSKVLRDAYGVSPQMRERVGAAIDELGYRPHTGARAMRGRSYTVGVVLSELTSPFQPEVAQGVQTALQDTPYQEIIVAAGGTDSARQKRSIEALIDRQVDGLVLVAPWLDTPYLEQLSARIPTVAVALHGASTTFDTVVNDDYVGAQLMVDHLVGLGHRRIVHTGMPPARYRAPLILSHTARQRGFEQAMTAHGLEPEVVVTSYTEEGGYRAALAALDGQQPPTAIFAGADIAALGALRAVEERGLRVPQDITVAGYDNIYVSTINRISLTTVDESGQMTGEVSARLLLERIDGRTQAVHYVVTPRLVARTTSAPPRSKTPAV